MIVYLVTGNRHKVEEIKALLKEFGVTVKQLKEEKIEPKDWTIVKTAEYNAQEIANRLGKNIIVDDTGFFLDAYNNFPGHSPAWIFKTIGYEGIFKLLEGKVRTGYFMTAAAFCKPGEKAKVFTGKMKGRVADKIRGLDKDSMPYNKIFVPDDIPKPYIELSLKERNSISQRSKAVKKLGKWLRSKSK